MIAKRCFHGEARSLSTDKSCQHSNDFELFRWNSVTAVDNNRKRLTFYFPDTLYFSVDHYSCLFLVTGNFPFQWMASGLATITIFRPDFTACFRYWKSAKLICATESSFHSRNKSSKICKEKFLKVCRSGYLEEKTSILCKKFIARHQ